MSGRAIAIPGRDRFRHAFVIGSTGTGKSTLLRRIASADIASGAGVLVIDPHGPLAEEVLADIPAHRRNQVCYLDPADSGFPIAMNLLEDTHPDDRAPAADGIVAAMRGIWVSGWGDRMEDILRNSLIALIEFPGGTLALLPRFLTEREFRARVVASCSNPIVRLYFEREFDTYSESFAEKAISPILNKVREFLIDPRILNMLGQTRSTLHIDRAMASGRIIIANLSKGAIGESGAHLLGALLIARVLTHAMERSRLAPEAQRPFHVIADEAANFATEATARLLSEGRKFNVSLALATQSLAQIKEPVRSILLANTATLVAFRTGEADAQQLAAEMQLGGVDALLNLGFGHAWMRAPWSGDVFPLTMPAPSLPVSDGSAARRQSRRHYGRNRQAAQGSVMNTLYKS